MSPQWAAERVVDRDLAGRLIRRQFPQLPVGGLRELATGWDNTVYALGEEWVFRFPRRESALDGVRREIAVLPGLARRLPLPLPDPELVGQPDDEYPWPWWGSRLVPGAELCDSGPAGEDRTGLARDVGRFLKALHDPGLARELDPLLPVDPLRRGDMRTRVPWTAERLETLQRNGIADTDQRAATLLREAGHLPSGGAPVVLLHGDLHVRHVLVSDGRASGVIDWGDVCLGDAAVDLSFAYGALAGPAREAFLSEYGAVDDESSCRARVLALFLCAALADYAHAESRPALLRESIAGLDRAVS